MEAKKLEIKSEKEEIKNLINEMLEDGEITLLELDSVNSVSQEKIDRFKERFSEELEDGVISEEEFKDNIKSHHRKGHHKSKGNR
jgi:Ca2+-binding EF-hand superfamily protein